ncbi:MAG: dehydrogenase, short-chain alcohol dehydrogenase like protein [Actinomycetia bacterium]|jgi:NAD(P)-dependent dehydrogenase (short-subunit alcohol dehydrogenase family)|nr:dehydrogenase, short-chain alcohol dehydrogenase like protein [Actinomycetes bacterium]
MELQDARAIVTGGASGIGAACVAQLQAAGARVVALDLTDAPAADGSLRVDVADEDAVVAGFRDAVAQLGGLDVAVLSAGVGGSAPLLDMTTQEWDRVLNVNLRGAFVSLREAARAITEGNGTRGGAIVAVTSISGFLSERLMAHYGVSKAGLAQLVRAAARELGARNIRVNAVAPGTTDTPMFGATERLPGYRDQVTRRAALGRVGTAADVAQAIVALCTLDWVTGQIVAADGGVSLHSPIDPQEALEANQR